MVDIVSHVHCLWLHTGGVCGDMEVARNLLNGELCFHPASTVIIDWDLGNVPLKTNLVTPHVVLDVEPNKVTLESWYCYIESNWYILLSCWVVHIQFTHCFNSQKCSQLRENQKEDHETADDGNNSTSQRRLREVLRDLSVNIKPLERGKEQLNTLTATHHSNVTQEITAPLNAGDHRIEIRSVTSKFPPNTKTRGHSHEEFSYIDAVKGEHLPR